MTTIYLVRHAEAEGNLYRRIHGHYNSLITDNGFCQIAALERRFREIHIDAVYSSDLYRTMTTARAVYLPKGLELHTDPELREINMGDWEDRCWGEIRHFEPEAMAQFNHSDPVWRAPHGESLADVGLRVERAVRRIAQAHPDQTVAIFSHGTAIRQTLANIQNLNAEDWHSLPHSENTAVTCLTWDGTRLQSLWAMDASHLDDSITTMARQIWWRKDAEQEERVNLWFRPIDWPGEKSLYEAAWQDAWPSVQGAGPACPAERLIQEAEACLSRSPGGLLAVMSGSRTVGLLQLDTLRYREEAAGFIPFVYLIPEYRGQHLGVQLIGQAVSFFRPLGRDTLRLPCAPRCRAAQHFCAKYGFVKTGEEGDGPVPVDILEKYIGYGR